MTTTVRVDAHCSPDKEVLVEVYEGYKTVPSSTAVLQDGESRELLAYGERIIRVHEVDKKR